VRLDEGREVAPSAAPILPMADATAFTPPDPFVTVVAAAIASAPNA